MRRLFCAIVLAACSGCFDNPEVTAHSRILPIVPKAEVPEHVRLAAAEHRPDLKFGGVFARRKVGINSARDRKGNGIAIDVTPEGSVVQVIIY